MNKMFVIIILILFFFYILICSFLYFFQEKLIFFPIQLEKNYQYGFSHEFEEINFKTQDGIALNSLLFKVKNPKGVIYYLHGNAGALNTWGEVASVYTELNYDVLIIDYRGYGKSEGTIESEKQVYSDIRAGYEYLKNRYPENKIIILGYSIGTGPATKIASESNAKLLILQAPYYSLTDMMKHYYPIIPSMVLKYKFETYKYLTECKMPVVIFHGTMDEVIYFNSSVKLKERFKSKDKLIPLAGQGHNGMTTNPNYLKELRIILTNPE